MTLHPSFYIIVALLLICATASYAQDIEATVLFKNGHRESVVLNRKAFNTENMLVTRDGAARFPLADVAEVVAQGRMFVPTRVMMGIQEIQPGDNEQQRIQLDTLLLLQKIVGGSMSLYNYIDHAENEHIFLEKQAQLQELSKVAFTKNGNTGYKDLYKGVLKIYLADCTALNSTNYDKVAFSLIDIKKLVKKYNQTCGQMGYESKPVKIKLHGGILIGLQHQNSKFNPNFEIIDFASKQIQLDHVGKSRPIFGAFLLLPLGKTHEKVYLELKPYLLSSMGFSNSTNAIKVDNTDTVDVNYSFRANYYNLMMMLRYNLNSSHTDRRFYLAGGLGFHGILKTSKNSISVRRYNQFGERFSNYEVFDEEELPKDILFFQAKIGVRLKRFDIGASYSFGKGGLTALEGERQKVFGVELGYMLF